jgi:hypothetical protein
VAVNQTTVLVITVTLKKISNTVENEQYLSSRFSRDMVKISLEFYKSDSYQLNLHIKTLSVLIIQSKDYYVLNSYIIGAMN